MSASDLLYLNAANYPYQKDRAEAYLRVVIALLLTNGPGRISAASRAEAAGPLSAFELVTHEDGPSGDLILTVVQK